MTICDKINDVGETLQENLNNRGVDCSFGTGTGESTVLDMVEMVNGMNFNGSSDVNLKIGANRPYLISGETTDVIVRLEDGLCEPLKNKNVTIEQSVFRDGGVTGNTNYTSFYNYATFNPQVTDTGTLLTNNVATTYNYYANLDSTSDLYDFTVPFTVEFDIVSFSGSTIGTQITESGQSGAIRTFSQLGITQPCHLKLIVTGTQIIYQVDNETVMTQNYTVTQARVSLILNSATLKYKNFVIYENITGVTDGKGEFALYDVEVSSDTTFTATYGTETATTNVYLCQFVDYGVSSNYNTNWQKGANVTLVRDERYTTFSNSSGTSALYQPYNATYVSGDIAVEWDNWATTYQLNYFIVTGSTDMAKTFGALYINKPCRVKITIIGTTMKCYIDGVDKATYTINRDSNDKVKVRLQINPTGDNIKYSNFRIKPL